MQTIGIGGSCTHRFDRMSSIHGRPSTIRLYTETIRLPFSLFTSFFDHNGNPIISMDPSGMMLKIGSENPVYKHQCTIKLVQFISETI